MTPVTPRSTKNKSPPKTPVKNNRQNTAIAPVAPMAPSRTVTFSEDLTMMNVSSMSDETTLVDPAPVSPATPRRKRAILKKTSTHKCWVCNVALISRSKLAHHLQTKNHFLALKTLCDQSDGKKKMAQYIDWCNAHEFKIDDLILAEFKKKTARGRRDGFANSHDFATREAVRLSQDPYRGMYGGGPPRMSLMAPPKRPSPGSVSSQLTPTRPPLKAANRAPSAIFNQFNLDSDDSSASLGGVAEYRPYGRSPILAHKVKKASAYCSHGNYSATMIKLETSFEIYGTSAEREPPALKGLILPGMGIWDSATPSQRRYRNQRKDIEATMRIERAANSVGTREIIFDLNMDFLRERDICEAVSIPNSPTMTELALNSGNQYLDGNFDIDQAMNSGPSTPSGRSFPHMSSLQHGHTAQVLPSLSALASADSYAPYATTSHAHSNQFSAEPKFDSIPSNVRPSPPFKAELTYEHGLPHYSFGYKMHGHDNSR